MTVQGHTQSVFKHEPDLPPVFDMFSLIFSENCTPEVYDVLTSTKIDF